MPYHYFTAEYTVHADTLEEAEAHFESVDNIDWDVDQLPEDKKGNPIFPEIKRTYPKKPLL